MAETVYLAPGDEIASIKEKLNRAKGNPVVLIAPRSVKCLKNPLALKLVKRHAEYLGKDLVLVAPSRTVRYLAQYHGMPVCSSLTQVRRWKPKDGAHSGVGTSNIPLDKRGSRVGSAGLAGGFLALIALFLPFTVGYFVVPSATVNLYAATQNLSENVSISASTDAKVVDYQAAIIPGRVVEAHLEVTDQTDIAGKKAVPDASATGQVTFMNRGDGKVTVPKGTQLAARNGIKFRTMDEATLPAAKGSNIRVAIIADQPGKGGNVEKWAIDQVLDQQLASQASVVNENPTQGGTDKEVGAVTAQDRSRLETQALAKAKNEMFQKLLSTKKASESIYPQSISVQVVDTQFDRRVGEETKTLSLKLLVKGTAVAFEARDVNEVTTKTITQKVPNGMKIDAGGINIKPLGAEKWTDRVVSFYVQADARAVTAADEDQIKREIAGMSRDAAERYIADTLVLADDPEVRIEPGWTGTVPRFIWRIKVNQRTP